MESTVSTTIYKISKIDNVNYCKTNGQFSRHIAAHNLTYRAYHETYETGICVLCDCGQPATFYQKTEMYAGSCGMPKCVGSAASNTKSKWSAAQKHQDSANKQAAAAARTDEQRHQQLERARVTFKTKYGVAWGSEMDSQKEKSKKTKLEKYGIETYNNSKSISLTNLAKSLEEKNAINQKRRDTNLKKYGIANVLMSQSIRQKSAKSNCEGKLYKLPSGNNCRIRGYENLALDILFYISGYTESQLVIDDADNFKKNLIPTFQYISVARHKLHYFPDIYIPHENRIIEVKSQWWWDGNGKDKYQSRLKNNLRKRQAVIDAGHNYEVWIFSSNTQYEILK